VLDTAIREISELVERGYELSVAVNFSMKQFHDELLLDKTYQTLRRYNFPPELFILEMTESTLMENPEKTIVILNQLRSLGVKIAIDDFGTGYSSLKYLIEFNVDKIKIDKSFTISMLKNLKAWNIVKTIIELTHSIDALTLAEGVETEELLRELVKLHCDEGQGYYFSPPLSFEKLIELLKRGVYFH